jgi:hypothetical protein
MCSLATLAPWVYRYGVAAGDTAGAGIFLPSVEKKARGDEASTQVNRRAELSTWNWSV